MITLDHMGGVQEGPKIYQEIIEQPLSSLKGIISACQGAYLRKLSYSFTALI